MILPLKTQVGLVAFKDFYVMVRTLDIKSKEIIALPQQLLSYTNVLAFEFIFIKMRIYMTFSKTKRFFPSACTDTDKGLTTHG